MSTASIFVLAWLAIVAPPAGGAATVQWSAPPQCGSAPALEERIVAQVGELEADILISGRVTQTEGLYALDLEIDQGGDIQRRAFSADNCQTLVDAVVLVSAAALAPEPADAGPPEVNSAATLGPPDDDTSGQPLAESPQPEPAPSEPPPAEPAPPDTTDTPPTLEPSPRGAIEASLRIGGSYDGTPVLPGGSVGLGYQAPRWRVELHLDAFGRRVAASQLDLAVVAADLRACPVWRPHPSLALAPCAGITVGPAIGRGRGLRNARMDVVPWSAAHLDISAFLDVSRRLALGAELSALAMITRPRFSLSDGEHVYRAGYAAGRAFFVLRFRFSGTDRAAARH